MRREKVNGKVEFPLTDLDLSPFVLPFAAGAAADSKSAASAEVKKSADGASSPSIEGAGRSASGSSGGGGASDTKSSWAARPRYDCIGVINHLGNIVGGHYTAAVRADRADLPPLMRAPSLELKRQQGRLERSEEELPGRWHLFVSLAFARCSVCCVCQAVLARRMTAP